MNFRCAVRLAPWWLPVAFRPVFIRGPFTTGPTDRVLRASQVMALRRPR